MHLFCESLELLTVSPIDLGLGGWFKYTGILVLFLLVAVDRTLSGKRDGLVAVRQQYEDKNSFNELLYTHDIHYI